MKKGRLNHQLEAHSWTQLEKCLATLPSKNHVNQVKALLTDINKMALEKGCYNAMGHFYIYFFSELATGTRYISVSDRIEERHRELGIAKREATGGCSKIWNQGLWNDEIENVLDRLSNLIHERFKKLEQLEPSPETIRSIKETEALSKNWRENTRLIEAANLLKAIGYPKHLKTIRDLLKLVPPYENLTSKAIGSRVKRHS